MAVRRRIRLGMVGGGRGALIGGVHRLAARMDDHYELVAGALSSDPERARASGAEIGLAPERSYADYREMAQSEARREDGIEAVAIVTPNHLHFPVAMAFLEAGIHVICDKPLALDTGEAHALASKMEETGLLFAVTYNYSGYPMIRQARAMVAAGELGAIRLVQVEYAQGWLARDIETGGHKQAEWRTDPARAGAGGAIGDIGTHAYHLARFVSGLRLDALSADLTSFVKGRQLDDNASVMLRFKGGAKGHIWASQVAVGCENGLRLRIFGTRGGLDWHQESPDHLWQTALDQPKRLLTRAGAGILPQVAALARVPAGHPEGYLEGFATIYADIAGELRARLDGRPPSPTPSFPTIADGVEGMEFVDAVIRSAAAGGRWTSVP